MDVRQEIINITIKQTLILYLKIVTVFKMHNIVLQCVFMMHLFLNCNKSKEV